MGWVNFQVRASQTTLLPYKFIHIFRGKVWPKQLGSKVWSKCDKWLANFEDSENLEWKYTSGIAFEKQNLLKYRRKLKKRILGKAILLWNSHFRGDSVNTLLTNQRWTVVKFKTFQMNTPRMLSADSLLIKNMMVVDDKGTCGNYHIIPIWGVW